MYIKNIILDGFKSYGQRTEITGFDNKFTAITGLNGSGKSNILDAICFVLGISNLNQVRAGSLQDLIYKSGQAGINKATVSIIFDNTNPDQCPPGLEEYKEIIVTRQIEIGGKSKYFVNGFSVTNKKVQDMFCSIHLNVNNPQFLIMQGKVTKVLNMKSPEILSMIEETAGTRMYETKKRIAEQTITKKDVKLNELNSLMNDEILPKFDKARKESEQYNEFKKLERDLEHKLELFKAWQLVNIKRSVKKTGDALEAGNKQIKEIKENIENNNKMIKKIDHDIEESNKKAQSEVSEKVQQLKDELKEKEKHEAGVDAQLKSIKKNISSEEKMKENLIKHLKDDENALKSKKNELKELKNLFEKLRSDDEKDNEAFALSQKRYEALCAGMEVNEEGEAETLQEQLMSAKQAQIQMDLQFKQATMQLTACQNDLKDKESNLKSPDNEYKQYKAKLEDLEKNVKLLENNLQQLNYSEENRKILKETRTRLIEECHDINERIKTFQTSRPYTKFEYDEPEPNFNRKSVHNVVCRLIKIKDPKQNVAVETIAGGRLYNVVVDSDVTVKKLLKNGNLRLRTTFIPLDKLQARRMNNNIVKQAEALVGKENVQPAWNSIECDAKYQTVVDFVFGNAFICKDLNVARKIAFNENIKKLCVTLDGDLVNPSGLLSGGAPRAGGSVLTQLIEIMKLEETFQQKQIESKKITQQLKEIENVKYQFDLKRNELNVIKSNLENTKYYRDIEEINNLKNKINELNKQLESSKENEEKFNKKIKMLENKMKTYNKEIQLKEAESEMKRLKEVADKSRKKWQEREQDCETINLELKELNESVEHTKEQIKTIENKIEELKTKINEINENLNEIKSEIDIVQGKIKEEETTIAQNNRAVRDLIEKKEELQAQNNEFELNIKKINIEVNKLEDEYKMLRLKEKDLGRKHIDEKSLENANQLSETEGENLEKTIRIEQDRKNKMGRTINVKAQSMINQLEGSYVELCRKTKIVKNDKNKLLTVIKQMNKKKEQVIKVAHEQISKDFGSILGTLLPGANAKLVAPKGRTIMDGLEINVSLGNVWKESLTELSGGQRSLAALSLILAMLLYKPAPLYILDEVDAALDLHHTQNIGKMIRNYFKKSQFIIVSLKDGMFNNANVLFRTKFVDGVSTVSKTENRNK